MQIKNIKTKQEFEEFANELIGEGKDCEKNLLTALYLFIKDFCPADELDLEHVLALVLSTKIPRGLRNPQSDVDKIFEMVTIVNPTASCLVYHNAFKLYPEGMQNQAAGNLVYKICARLNDWPKCSNTVEFGKPVDKWMDKNKNTTPKDIAQSEIEKFNFKDNNENNKKK